MSEAVPSSWRMVASKDQRYFGKKTGIIIHVNGAASAKIVTAAASVCLNESRSVSKKVVTSSLFP